MLEQYKQKRNFGVTPEPDADAPIERGEALRFVVQKHAATRLHYDFRLEFDGVLKSWAVPKGPSLSTKEKRLAVMTEDHPLSYASFEGEIPQGQYGAGSVIVWDEGTYVPDEKGYDPFISREEAERQMIDGLKKGKLSVTLHGSKMKGSWTLVKTKKEEDSWLLIKHQDEYASETKDILELDSSVLSGRTIEGRSGRSSRVLPHAERKSPLPQTMMPMLATETNEPFSSPAWSFEVKLDGIRAIAILDRGQVKVLSRNAKDITAKFPEVSNELKAIPHESLILDGEIVMFDSDGRPTFQGLMDRFHLESPHAIHERSVATPSYFYAFDVMYLDGEDLRKRPFKERRTLLEQLEIAGNNVRRVDAFPEHGKEIFEHATALGFEGIVAKKQDSPYQDGMRTGLWQKIKSYSTREFVVGGYTTGEGSRRNTFGALLVGEWVEGKLVYAGNVGGGFSEAALHEVKQALDALKIDRCPFSEVPELKGATVRVKPVWVEPRMWVEVRFMSWTRDKRLRFPTFLRTRPDLETDPIPAAPIVNQEQDQRSEISMVKQVLEQLDDDKKNMVLEIGPNTLNLTNLDKVLWPGEGEYPATSKRDYLRYLARMSDVMLPHLRDRPITLTRYPNGIHGEMFFQKHPESAPSFVERLDIYSKRSSESRDFFLVNNLASLLWCGQMGALEIHPWYSRTNPEPDAKHLWTDFSSSEEALDKSTLNYPDFMVIDLDPYLYSGKEAEGEEPEFHEAGFREVCRIAVELKSLLDTLQIPAYVKTSGKTGLHIYVPMKRDFDYDEVRKMAETIGMHLAGQLPERVTLEWSVPKRKGKVFFDYNQNSRGKTLASIFSPRPTPRANVSFPVAWEDLLTLHPGDYTVHTVPAMIDQKGDPWADILKKKHDFGGLFK